MAATTTIEWTDATWNPVTGCTKISPGCDHCYAERLAKRLQAMGNPSYQNGFAVTLQPRMLRLPYKWRKPRLVFVDSMGDLFHEEVPATFIQLVFRVMSDCSYHRFQLLTKRSARLRELSQQLPWPDNLWMGVTVECQDYLGRVDDLRATAAAVKFVSFEPLIQHVDSPDLSDIDWAIVGGESGPGARPIQPEWVIALREACRAQSVAFFFKQWGGQNKKRAGRLLDGTTWDDMPSGIGTVRQRTTCSRNQAVGKI